MPNKSVANRDIRKMTFMMESSWILHFGQNFEGLVLRSIRDKVPVISVTNVNGSTSALPLDRAKYLLDKYYKMTGKISEEQDEQESRTHPTVSQFFSENALHQSDFRSRKIAANG